MIEKNYDNNLFGWNGVISRKDYAVNMFIAASAFTLLHLTNFHAFEQFISFKLLYIVLVYAAAMLKWVFAMCAVSLVYRRAADFARLKPYRFKEAVKRLFTVLYVLPLFYILVIRYFLSLMPAFINIMDAIVFFALLPAAFICAVILCFIKGAA